MSELRRICVFCGSHHGHNPRFAEAAKALGVALARRGIGLVYGGGRVGLMGVIADSALEAGAEVIGVIPGFLDRAEVAHDGLTELRRVDTMLERKTVMAELSDGYITLPGGLGTLDELFEALTASQLRLDVKPCGLLDVDGYYAGLVGFLDRAQDEGFLPVEHRSLLMVGVEIEELLDRMSAGSPA